MARTSRPLHIFPIVLRKITVVEVTDVTPCMRRITFSGDFAAGTSADGIERPALRSLGFDDHVKLVFPQPGQVAADLGTQTATGFAWQPGVLQQSRDYTVRRWDPDQGLLDVDLVMHDDGLAASWAAAARVDDAIFCAGPKSSAEVNHEVDWHLLVGDETALPAIGRWLDEAPAGLRARVFIEVPTNADRQQLSTRADADITWLIREDEHPAGHSPLLFDAVAAWTPWPGRGFAWCAGEAMTLKPIRRHLRSLLPSEDVEVVGYWRRVEHVPSEEGTSASPLELRLAVHEETELGPVLVVRTAITLGIAHRLAESPCTVQQLSEWSKIPSDRLRPLLIALTALGYVRRTDEAYANTAKGELLTEDSAASLALDHPYARDELALLDLADMLVSGRRREPDLRESNGLRDRRAELAEEQLTYVLGPLTELPEVRGAGHVAALGESAPVIAASLATRERRVSCVVSAADRSRAEKRLARLPERVRSRIELQNDSDALPAVDTYVLSSALTGADDAAVADLVSRVAGLSDRVVLMTEVADGAEGDDHVAVEALVTLVTTGVPLRTTGEIEALVARFGKVRTQPLGWGFSRHVVCLDASV